MSCLWSGEREQWNNEDDDANENIETTTPLKEVLYFGTCMYVLQQKRMYFYADYMFSYISFL